MRTNDLRSRMEMDHVVLIRPGGVIDDAPDGIHAPELLMDSTDDGDILAYHEKEYVESAREQGWELESGWTGQYSYNGVIMHSSEFIGGRLAEHILTHPGLWVALPVNMLLDIEGEGWVLAFRPYVRPSGAYRCPCCGDDFVGTTWICQECESAGCEQSHDASGDVGYWECARDDVEEDAPAITPDMAGTWLDGCQGWHNVYRVIDRATEYGFVVPQEYEGALADFRENGPASSEDSWEAMHGQGELCDKATDFLQSLAPAGYAFEWDMGELSLVRVCQNADGPCPNACDCGCAMGEYECACES